MGFFFDDAAPPTIEGIAPARSGPKPRAAKSRTPGGIGCDHCSLKSQWPSMSTPRMPIQGPKDADILVLGGAPTKDGDFKGKPFGGAINQLVLDCIPGHARDRVAFQNVARCLPTGPPSHDDVHACSIYLDEDAASRPFKFVLGVGGVTLARFWEGASVQRVHGVHIPIVLGGKPLWFFPIIDPAFVDEKGGMRTSAGATLRADIMRLFRDGPSWGKPRVETISPRDVIVCKTEAEARKHLAEMGNMLAVDIETSKLKPYMFDARILSAAFSDGARTIAWACNHPETTNLWGQPLLLETIQRRPWIAHNAAFEFVWFAWMLGDEGASIAPFHDSQAQARTFFDRETIAGLDDCTQAVLGVNIKSLTGIKAANILEYPLSEMLPYNGLDAWASARIDDRLWPEMADDPNYQRILDAVRTTARMEMMGLPVDIDMSKALKTEWGDKASGIKAAAAKMYEVRQFELERQTSFNIASTVDVGIALVEYGRLKLPKNARGYTTDDATLTAATKESPNPLADAVLDYREAKKNEATYIDPILAVPTNYIDGLLHPSYTVMLVRTGRLSSTDPNIQNFPKRRHREVRRQLIPPPGHLLVPLDYAQLEARVIAMASKDAKLCSSIISGYDVHSYWRDRILDRYPDYYDRLVTMSNETEKAKVLKSGRNTIKTDFVFASFFGASAASCATRTGIPPTIMEEIQGEFWQDFRGVKQWIKNQRNTYNDTGAVSTLTGRTRRGILWGNEPINTPVQGTAADVVIDAMNELAQLSIDMKEPALMPRINVHDDLTLFLPDGEDTLEYLDVAMQVMTKLRYSWQTVPFVVEASAGTNWADVEEIGIFTGPYRR